MSIRQLSEPIISKLQATQAALKHIWCKAPHFAGTWYLPAHRLMAGQPLNWNGDAQAHFSSAARYVDALHYLAALNARRDESWFEQVDVIHCFWACVTAAACLDIAGAAIAERFGLPRKKSGYAYDMKALNNALPSPNITIPAVNAWISQAYSDRARFGDLRNQFVHSRPPKKAHIGGGKPTTWHFQLERFRRPGHRARVLRRRRGLAECRAAA